MKIIKSLSKRYFLIISSLLLAICFFIIIIVFDNKNDNTDLTETSDYFKTESTVFLIESSVSYTESQSEESIVEEKTPTQMLVGGEVTTVFSRKANVGEIIYPLMDWFCKNKLTEYGTVDSMYYLMNERVYNYFNEFKLYSATFIVTFTNNKEKYVTILYGSLNKDEHKYILIDGQITISNYYSLEDAWEKVQENVVFGKYADEYPIAVSTKGMNELDLGSLIGEGRIVYSNFPISETTVAIVSVLPDYFDPGTHIYNWRPTNLKIDFIDITSGKLIYDSHQLTDIRSKGYRIMGGLSGYFIDNNNILFGILVSSPYNDNTYYAWYKLTIDSTGKINDTLVINQDAGNYNSLKIESGQYETFYQNDDLFLHDNVSEIDILVYDAFVFTEDENYDFKDYHFASVAFFVGDELYFNVTAGGDFLGCASYNPKTNKTIDYFNKIYAQKYIYGYIYGTTSNDDLYGRFRIDDMKNIDLLNLKDKTELPYSQFLYSSDEKYLIMITVIVTVLFMVLSGLLIPMNRTSDDLI
ncbi:MAG: hypothetical protein A2Y15_02200 [Clostridiales bacterium GWF2_36_10]|nr:MAG: hypothetical protein A2Y15_02200 [Clostridiales bacterium GWF2_36_10]HAN21292.1 hypothetical protein [Clostridiales bacterium]